MAAERNDFNVNLGDTIYSDSEVGGVPPARTVPDKWAKYRLGLALPALRRLRASTGLYSHWDDHEFVNDFTLPGARRGDLPRRDVKAFRDYSPVAVLRGSASTAASAGAGTSSSSSSTSARSGARRRARPAAATSRRPRRRRCASAFAAPRRRRYGTRWPLPAWPR